MLLRKGLCDRAAVLAVMLILASAVGTLAGEMAIPNSDAVEPPAAVNSWPANPAINGPRVIAIVESQSQMAGHDMDVEWQAIAIAMGHTASIVNQDALDDIANFVGTDILIVSSGIIDLPPGRVQTILEFVESHRPVYLQGEYDCGYSANLAFLEIVTALGGAFTPTGTVEGDLQPMNVLGSLSYHTNAVPSLPYFWWGCAGTGDASFENFLEYDGDYFGWIFTQPSGGPGTIIHTTDQDWARQADIHPESAALMENILTYLDEHGFSPVEKSSWGTVKSLYR